MSVSVSSSYKDERLTQFIHALRNEHPIRPDELAHLLNGNSSSFEIRKKIVWEIFNTSICANTSQASGETLLETSFYAQKLQDTTMRPNYREVLKSLQTHARGSQTRNPPIPSPQPLSTLPTREPPEHPPFIDLPSDNGTPAISAPLDDLLPNAQFTPFLFTDEELTNLEATIQNLSAKEELYLKRRLPSHLEVEENLQLIQACVALGRRNLHAAPIGPYILTVGDTGAGKSVTINYSLGCNYQFDNNRKLMPVQQDLEVAQVGRQRMSQTLIPQSFPIPGGYIADLPGLLDTRAGAISIGNGVNMTLIKEKATALRFMLILTKSIFNDQRGQGVQRCFNVLRQMTRCEADSLSQSILFGITKCENTEEVRKEILGDLQEILQLTVKSDQLVIIDPTNPEGRAELLGKMENLLQSPCPSLNEIHPPISHADQSLIRGMLDTIDQKIKTALGARDIKTICKYMYLFSRLAQFVPTEVNQYMSTTSENLNKHFKSLYEETLAASRKPSVSDELRLEGLKDSLLLFKQGINLDSYCGNNSSIGSLYKTLCQTISKEEAALQNKLEATQATEIRRELKEFQGKFYACIQENPHRFLEILTTITTISHAFDIPVDLKNGKALQTSQHKLMDFLRKISLEKNKRKQTYFNPFETRWQSLIDATKNAYEEILKQGKLFAEILRHDTDLRRDLEFFITNPTVVETSPEKFISKNMTLESLAPLHKSFANACGHMKSLEGCTSQAYQSSMNAYIQQLLTKLRSTAARKIWERALKQAKECIDELIISLPESFLRETQDITLSSLKKLATKGSIFLTLETSLPDQTDDLTFHNTCKEEINTLVKSIQRATIAGRKMREWNQCYQTAMGFANTLQTNPSEDLLKIKGPVKWNHLTKLPQIGSTFQDLLNSTEILKTTNPTNYVNCQNNINKLLEQIQNSAAIAQKKSESLELITELAKLFNSSEISTDAPKAKDLLEKLKSIDPVLFKNQLEIIQSKITALFNPEIFGNHLKTSASSYALSFLSGVTILQQTFNSMLNLPADRTLIGVFEKHTASLTQNSKKEIEDTKENRFENVRSFCELAEIFRQNGNNVPIINTLSKSLLQYETNLKSRTLTRMKETCALRQEVKPTLDVIHVLRMFLLSNIIGLHKQFIEESKQYFSNLTSIQLKDLERQLREIIDRKDSDFKDAALELTAVIPRFQHINEIIIKEKATVKHKEVLGALQLNPTEFTRLEQLYEWFEEESLKYFGTIARVGGDTEELLKTQMQHIEQTLKKEMQRLSLEIKGKQFSTVRKEVVQLLAAIAAMWTHKNADKHYTYETLGLKKVFPTQILAVFKLLHLDREGELSNHLLELKTGEGKAVILGILATFFALTGDTVDVVCYSPSLSKRDYNLFLPVFQACGIPQLSDKINYCTIKDLCEKVIKQKFGNIRQKSINLLCGNREEMREEIINNKERSILLIDEVDVFFGETFYSDEYRCGARRSNSYEAALVDWIWRNAQLQNDNLMNFPDLEQIIQSILSTSPKLEPFIRAWLPEIIQEARKIQNGEPTDPPYMARTKDQKIVYRDKHLGNEHTAQLSYGHCLTQFAYKSQGWKDPEGFGIEWVAGILPYSELPNTYSLKLGLTGTLKNLSNFEKAILQNHYNFSETNWDYFPSTFKKTPINVLETRIYEGSKTGDYFKAIRESIWREREKGRAVFVFFHDDEAIQEFKNFLREQPLGIDAFPMHIIHDEKEADHILNAAQPRKVTLMERSFGRGTDFPPIGQALLEKGGVHVIQTFPSEFKSEQIQIMGRTGRLDYPGSYEMLLYLQDLAPFGITSMTMFDGRNIDEYIDIQRNSELLKQKEKQIMNRFENIKRNYSLTEQILTASTNDQAVEALYALNKVVPSALSRPQTRPAPIPPAPTPLPAIMETAFTPEYQERRKNIEDFEKKITMLGNKPDRRNHDQARTYHCALFGVATSATLDEIKECRKNLLLRFNADHANQALDTEFKKRTEAIMKQIHESWMILQELYKERGL